MAKILAIDTSQKSLSLAVVADGLILAEFFIDSGRHHSETLMPAIEHVLRVTGLNLNMVDFFAVTTGPGSFTGLRIAAATVKGLALAVGKPVVGVSTLDVLARAAAPFAERLICPLLDARKNQVYTSLYEKQDVATARKIMAERLVDVENWLQELQGKILFIGDGAQKYSDCIRRYFPEERPLAEGFKHGISAGIAAQAAWEKFLQGELLEIDKFTPHYLRPSEAEIRNAHHI